MVGALPPARRDVGEAGVVPVPERARAGVVAETVEEASGLFSHTTAGNRILRGRLEVIDGHDALG